MRVMLDTNVLISLLLFPSRQMDRMMEYIFREHQLVLSSFVVEELNFVVSKKFPTKTGVIDQLLAQMGYELVYTPKEMDKSLFRIRDEMDYPVLYTAVMENIDLLITGDKDFADVDIDRPAILTPKAFIEKYVDTGKERG